jgi:hypothetical protein
MTVLGCGGVPFYGVSGGRWRLTIGVTFWRRKVVTCLDERYKELLHSFHNKMLPNPPDPEKESS